MQITLIQDDRETGIGGNTPMWCDEILVPYGPGMLEKLSIIRIRGGVEIRCIGSPRIQVTPLGSSSIVVTGV